jgi:microfibrillar-associated protein 1
LKREEIQTKNTYSLSLKDDDIQLASGNKTIQEKIESSEYETDSDDSDESDEEQHRTLLKPIFVPRGHRDTIRSREEEEEKIHLAEQKKLVELEVRKHKTRNLLAESLQRMEEREAMKDLTDNDSDAGLPDDADDIDDSDEYDAWRVREMGRMKREAETRETMLQEAQDIERRRNMTDEERFQEDMKLGKFKEKEKKKWKFLQKYYHKGVFYMDNTSLGESQTIKSSQQATTDADKNKDIRVDARLREYNEPTLEDKYNKEALPTVLQVKKFGFRGRTKYTHLVDQDTTDFKAPMRDHEGLQNKYMSKRAGVGDVNIRQKKRFKSD